MKSKSNQFQKTIFLTLCSITACVLVYFIFYKLSIVSAFPKGNNMLKFDANWFKGIGEVGYTYTPNSQSDIAFFPLFPYFWEWTSLNGFNISALNMVIFVVSFALLMAYERKDALYTMAISSLPCFVFFFMPYSEALFFLFGTLLLIGYQKKSLVFQFVGIFGCCLTRSAGTIFLPAMLFTELLAAAYLVESKKQIFRNCLSNLTACISGVLITIVVQGVQTGKWFYFIEVQKYWSRRWLIPSVPFTLKYPHNALGLDAVALLIGAIATLISIRWLFYFLKHYIKHTKTQQEGNNLSRSIFFSALFLSGVAIIDTHFTYDVGGRTAMRSIGRHLICTPFAIYFLNWLNGNYKPDSKDVYWILGLFFAGIYLGGVFEYIDHFAYYVLFGLAFLAVKFYPKFKFTQYVLLLFNLIWVVLFFNAYLNGHWIG